MAGCILMAEFGKVGGISYNSLDMTKKALLSKLKYFLWISVFILTSFLVGLAVYFRT